MLRHLVVLLLCVAALCPTAAAADDNVLCVQEQLAARGIDPGPIDGLMGELTRAASLALDEELRAKLPPLFTANAGQWCEALRDDLAQDLAEATTCEVDGTAVEITSSFESDAEGWTIAGDAGPQPVFANGAIGAADRQEGTTWYWVAPQKFRGDQRTALGGTLSYRLKVTPIAEAYEDQDVLIEGGGMVIARRSTTVPGVEYVLFTHPLDTSAGWSVVGTDSVATEQELCRVLSDIDSIMVRGEYAVGPDTGWLDDASLAPKPE